MEFLFFWEVVRKKDADVFVWSFNRPFYFTWKESPLTYFFSRFQNLQHILKFFCFFTLFKDHILDVIFALWTCLVRIALWWSIKTFTARWALFGILIKYLFKCLVKMRLLRETKISLENSYWEPINLRKTLVLLQSYFYYAVTHQWVRS